MAKTKRVCALLVRFVAFGATLAATIVMATSHERASFFAVSYEAKFSDTPAFKYFLIANAVASVYGFLVLFLPSESLLWKFIMVADMVFALLLTSGISAALAIAHVGKKGNSHAGWLPICGQVPKYCNEVAGALASGFAGVIIYVIILSYSFHRVLYPFLVEKS